jgi:hypothetical protein
MEAGRPPFLRAAFNEIFLILTFFVLDFAITHRFLLTADNSLSSFQIIGP